MSQISLMIHIYLGSGGEGTYFNSIKKGPGGAHRDKDA